MTALQKKKLIKGCGINLKHNHIGNGEIYHIRDHQCNKLANAIHKQKGCRIDMDGEQIEHHYKHGGGMFSWLKDKFNKTTVKALGEKALTFGIDAATNYAKSKTDGGFASNMALNAGSALAKNAVEGMGFVGGMGIKRRRGAGFRGGL